MSWTTTVAPADDRFHPTDGDPYWNEACFTTFRIPERNLLCLFYFYFRPNQKIAMAGPIIWDENGDEISNCLYYAWDWHLPIPEGADMFDFELANGFSVKTIELQQSYQYTFEGPDCSIDVTFTSSSEPHYMRLRDGDVDPGMFDYVKVTDQHSTGHYEHHGLMNGTMTIRGEQIDVVNAAVLRDHTWGPRPIRSNIDRMRGGYLYGQSPDGTAGFNVFSVSQFPIDEDPIVGTTEVITSGYYLKDGLVGHIAEGTRRCTHRGPDGRPLREVIEAVDEHGRELRAEGTVRNWLRWPGLFGDVMVFWCLETWDFDGYTDAPGELQDYMTYRHYRRFHELHGSSAVTA
ncbi:MAG: hypothetical protein JWO02_1862 [Solirubrobacterales bacterium]|nr:hypothetical protein [Solirubrobacterales bacterium]